MGPHPGCLEFRPPPSKHRKTVAPRTQTGCWVAAKNDQWSLHAWVSQWSVRARLETVQESLTKEDSLQSVSGKSQDGAGPSPGGGGQGY